MKTSQFTIVINETDLSKSTVKELKTARVLSYQRTQLSEDVKDCENDLEDNYVNLLLLGTSRVGFDLRKGRTLFCSEV